MSSIAKTGLALVILVGMMVIGVMSYLGSETGSPEAALSNSEQLFGSNDRSAFGLSNSNDTSLEALNKDILVVESELDRFDEDVEAARQGINSPSPVQAETLNRLIARVDDMRRLNDFQKTELKASIQAEIDSLNAGAVATSKTRVQNLLPAQVYILSAIDRVDTLLGMSQIIYVKLQSRIDEAPAESRTALSAELEDMNQKMTLTSASSTVLQSEILGLKFDDSAQSEFTSRRRSLDAARSSLLGVRLHLAEIRNDMRTMTEGLPSSE